jgi:hypothetical protein
VGSVHLTRHVEFDQVKITTVERRLLAGGQSTAASTREGFRGALRVFRGTGRRGEPVSGGAPTEQSPELLRRAMSAAEHGGDRHDGATVADLMQ